MNIVRAVGFAMLAGTVATAGCGLLSAPVSVPAAVAENANFVFTGNVVDSAGHPLDGVVVQFHKVHHFWTPVKGSADVTTDRTLRVDKTFNFEERGASLELTFSKDNYRVVVCRLDADHANEVSTRQATWPNVKNFPVVMIPTANVAADGFLARFDTTISYANYPVADSIALLNLATEGRTGDILYNGKNANDPTIFPPGTLYLTLTKEPPPAINAKGDIDPADLDIPHHVTLHIAGGVGGEGSGFVSIEPRIGFLPMATLDTAPAAGYVPELTISRARLKTMRASSGQDVRGSSEYFFFRAGNRYGKGIFSWASSAGKPAFRYELFLQPVAENQELVTHGVDK